MIHAGYRGRTSRPPGRPEPDRHADGALGHGPLDKALGGSILVTRQHFIPIDMRLLVMLNTCFRSIAARELRTKRPLCQACHLVSPPMQEVSNAIGIGQEQGSVLG